MSPQTFILLGSSGSGKGTQSKKLYTHLREVDSEREILELGMGDLFREFWGKEGYTNARSREILNVGGLQPDFLQIYTWTQFFIDNLRPDEHLLIDGTPRRVEDARAMDSAFSFYGRERPIVIYLRVSREWSRERLIARATSQSSSSSLRALEDRDEAKIESRLTWFEEFALPAIDFFRDKPEYTFIEIDGEQPIERVHADIIAHITTLYS